MEKTDDVPFWGILVTNVVILRIKSMNFCSYT